MLSQCCLRKLDIPSCVLITITVCVILTSVVFTCVVTYQDSVAVCMRCDRCVFPPHFRFCPFTGSLSRRWVISGRS